MEADPRGGIGHLSLSWSSRGDGCLETAVIHLDDVSHPDATALYLRRRPKPFYDPKTADLLK
jgi:hypothetical protein